jgi:flagellin
MPQIINTNVMSLNSQRALNMSQKSMATSLERLSSGLRVNRAADDAAGLAIAERFTSQVRGLGVAIRNANDGISMAQTGEGAMAELTNSFQRMRELAVQASNGIYNTNDRTSLDLEYQQLKEEVGRIINATEFNDKVILASPDAIDFQVGYKSGTQNIITVSALDLTDTAAAADITSITLDNPPVVGYTGAITTSDSAKASLDALSDAINAITGLRAEFGAAQNRLESTIRNLENVIENQSAARSRIMDADFAAETANLTRTQILQQAGTAMLAQANQLPGNVLSLLG